MNEYLPVPQPEEVSQRERDDAMGSYLMMFASWAVGLPLPMINVVASIIYYFANRNKGPYVRFHALQSLYSQVLIGLVNSASIVWIIIMVINETFDAKYFIPFIIMAVIANILYITFSIIAAVYARKGRFFYFFFFGRLSYMQAYSATNPLNTGEEASYTNRPPA